MKKLISLVGPTGIGKTRWSLEMARRFGLPVVGADSVQVHRGLDIGSGKVTVEEMGEVPHHLIDVVDPCGELSAGEYGRKVEELLPELFRQWDAVLLVGGSGFYLQAVWDGFDEMPPVDTGIRDILNAEHREKGLIALVQELRRVDPETFEKVDRRNPMRVIRALEVYRSTGKPISSFRQGNSQGPARNYTECRMGLEMDRPDLYDQINRRVEGMVNDGLLEEVKTLLEAHGPDCKGLLSVGYRELVGYLQGETDWEEALRLVKRNHRRYAKRQMTWFRKYDSIKWFHPSELDKGMDFLEQFLTTHHG